MEAAFPPRPEVRGFHAEDLMSFLLLAALVTLSDRVFMVGDSQAYLLQRPLAALAKADGVTFGAHPVPGSSVISWSIGHQEGWSALRTFHPTVVLVSLGSNDACTGIRVVRNEPPYLARMLKRLDKYKVVWLGPLKIGGAPEGCGQRDCLSRAIPGLEAFYQMVSPKVQYLDARTIVIPTWDDLLHPNATGQVTWANWIWRGLIK